MAQTLQIGSAVLPVKDYRCADESGAYIPKDSLQLPEGELTVTVLADAIYEKLLPLVA